MPVFISHRTADDVKAQMIAWHLEFNYSIHCYLDHFDPEAEGTAAITSLLVSRIEDCTHLMALITDETAKAQSWWVPFEIGVARHAERRITSYDSSSVRLPEYLSEWPVMRSTADLDKFAKLYLRDRTGRPTDVRFAESIRDIQSADEFHNRLKASLRGYAVR